LRVVEGGYDCRDERKDWENMSEEGKND